MFGGSKDAKTAETIKTNIQEQKEKNILNFDKAQKPLEPAISSSGLIVDGDKNIPSEISMIHIFILNFIKFE